MLITKTFEVELYYPKSDRSETIFCYGLRNKVNADIKKYVNFAKYNGYKYFMSKKGMTILIRKGSEG